MRNCWHLPMKVPQMLFRCTRVERLTMHLCMFLPDSGGRDQHMVHWQACAESIASWNDERWPAKQVATMHCIPGSTEEDLVERNWQRHSSRMTGDILLAVIRQECSGRETATSDGQIDEDKAMWGGLHSPNQCEAIAVG